MIAIKYDGDRYDTVTFAELYRTTKIVHDTVLAALAIPYNGDQYNTVFVALEISYDGNRVGCNTNSRICCLSSLPLR